MATDGYIVVGENNAVASGPHRILGGLMGNNPVPEEAITRLTVPLPTQSWSSQKDKSRGLEDFGVILRPIQPLLASLAECELLTYGFAANGTNGLPHEFTYRLRDEAKNIEALLKRDPSNDALVSHLSIRYAICQPEAATQAFLDIVTHTAAKFCLQITGLASGVEFSCDTLEEFEEYAREEVRQTKARWSSLFVGDTEEIVVSVAGSWPYFIAKHPEVMQSKRVLVR